MTQCHDAKETLCVCENRGTGHCGSASDACEYMRPHTTVMVRIIKLVHSVLSA
jgi:hypothetical protein